MENRGPLCLTCAELDHLVFVPRGDAALTRRTRKASALSAVVVCFSRSRRRFERQGLLVEVQALDRAEEECLADEEARARRRIRERERRAEQDEDFKAAFATAILGRFPGCPNDRAQEVAGHAAHRGSGRVGRSAAGRALDPEVVRLAVVGSVRHVDTRLRTICSCPVWIATSPERWSRVRLIGYSTPGRRDVLSQQLSQLRPNNWVLSHQFFVEVAE
jgi:hypothetical protein